jgi:quinol monooxygenase YgiN
MKYIFKITIKQGYSAEQYAAAWVQASKLIQQSPGALGTELHRMIGNPDVLLAIAHWQSKAAREAMDDNQSVEVKKIIQSQAPFVKIDFIGEFEEPEWTVRPQQT